MLPRINIDDYNYELPDERIAKYPLSERDASRLLVYGAGRISHRIFRELPGLIEPGTLMVFNDTRVVQARMRFVKETGAKIEIFCLEPWSPAEYNLAFQAASGSLWKCLVGNAGKWKEGALEKEIRLHGKTIRLLAEKTGREKDAFLIRFHWEPPGITFGEILEKAGTTPIPPYLNRESEEGDRASYQTVYSRIDGSVAAPTAGLHFTQSVLKDIAARGIPSIKLTLHVGAGTFQPVITREISGHPMHAEHFYVDRSAIETLLKHPGRILAVGTTTTRVLESLYRIGLRLTGGDRVAGAENDRGFFLDQWEAYGLPEKDRRIPLRALLEYLDRNRIDILEGITRLMILPGYRFGMADRMLTNYHLPRSTLLLLVAAFIGEDWRRVYRYALENGFRFLSYGDSSLLMP
jgi:S-adenosylmethionine:tRNA ribosyltransferase-isomerase